MGPWMGVSHRVSVRVLSQQERSWSCQSRAAKIATCQAGSCSPPARPAHSAAFLPQELTGAAPPCGTGTRARPCAGHKPLKETHSSGELSKCQAKEFGLLPDRCPEGKAFPCFFFSP